MTESKDKIRNLFSEARDGARNGGRRRDGVLLRAAALVLLFAVPVLVYFYLDRHYTAEMERLEAEYTGMASRVDGLTKTIEEQKLARIRADQIAIKNLNIRRMNGEIRVSGEIANTGGLSFGEIELTAYCTDASGKPVCEKSVLTSSSDGKPLVKGQRRSFDIRIENPPVEAEGVTIVPTMIKTSD